jgi:hypothetical protein
MIARTPAFGLRSSRSRGTSPVDVVPEEGVEPSRPCGHGILSPARLPFRHSGTSTAGPPRKSTKRGGHERDPRVVAVASSQGAGGGARRSGFRVARLPFRHSGTSTAGPPRKSTKRGGHERDPRVVAVASSQGAGGGARRSGFRVARLPFRHSGTSTAGPPDRGGSLPSRHVRFVLPATAFATWWDPPVPAAGLRRSRSKRQDAGRPSRLRRDGRYAACAPPRRGFLVSSVACGSMTLYAASLMPSLTKNQASAYPHTRRAHGHPIGTMNQP